MFFYNTRRFIETGSLLACLGGNAPLIVSRATGEVTVTGTAYPIEHYLAEFERTQRG